MDVVQQLREQAATLLQEKKVELVIGYGEGTEVTRATPIFISSPEEASKLIWGPFCVNNLAKYLLNFRERKVGVVVKGCDSRAVNRLVSDNQIARDNVLVLGVPCPGILDSRKVSELLDPASHLQDVSMGEGEFILKTDCGVYTVPRNEYLLNKCHECENPNPVVSDLVFGVELPVVSGDQRFAEVRALELLETDEKSAYWDKQFSRCLRCYSCRNVCPVCTCQQCVFDQVEPNWISQRNNLSENTSFQLIRAFHVAGRCVDCGECDRVCPVDIPLRKLNRKIMKDLVELFDAPTPGSRPGLESALGGFSTGDPEEFM